MACQRIGRAEDEQRFGRDLGEIDRWLDTVTFVGKRSRNYGQTGKFWMGGRQAECLQPTTGPTDGPNDVVVPLICQPNSSRHGLSRIGIEKLDRIGQTQNDGG